MNKIRQGLMYIVMGAALLNPFTAIAQEKKCTNFILPYSSSGGYTSNFFMGAYNAAKKYINQHSDGSRLFYTEQGRIIGFYPGKDIGVLPTEYQFDFRLKESLERVRQQSNCKNTIIMVANPHSTSLKEANVSDSDKLIVDESILDDNYDFFSGKSYCVIPNNSSEEVSQDKVEACIDELLSD